MISQRRKNQRGGSALEMALFLPWYIFLFIGTFDWGFYAHALISTESAARVAVLYTSTSSGTAADSTNACIYANEELRISANVPTTPSCSSSPLVVTATSLTSTSADGQAASQVTVQYTTIGLIPIPGLLESSATFYRVVQMRLRS